MSNLKQRLARLEVAKNVDNEPLRIAHFIVTPGNLKPIGYRCDGIEIMRCHDDSEESFTQRCFDAVTWNDGNY